MRTRASPLPTVGNTIAGQNTPSSKRRRANVCVTSSSPVITGVIGVSLAPVSKPSAFRPSLSEAVFAHSRASRSGSSSMIASASMQAATTAGGALVENRKGRPRFWSHSVRCAGPAMNPPRTPIAFESVPTWMSTRPWSPK